MPAAKVIWLENEQFVGIDSSRHSVVMSTQSEGNAVGMRPSEMLLAAVAGCTAVDVVNILKKKRIQLTDLEIQAQGEQAADPPWPYTHIHLTYRLSGHGLTARAVEQAIELSEQKYCSVSASLRPQVKITTSFEIIAKSMEN